MSLIYKGKAKGFPGKGHYTSGGVRYYIELGKPITPEPPEELRRKMLKIEGFCEEEKIEPAIAKTEKAEDKPKTTSTKAKGLAGGE